jgi:hypothetical protein
MMMVSKDSGTVVYFSLTKTGLYCRLVCMKINQFIDRPKQYWLADGIVDLTLGAQWLLAGAIFLAGLTLGGGYAVAAPLLWGTVSFGTMWALKKWKERWIAPRTGYVALDMSRKDGTSKSSRAGAWLGFLVAMLGCVGVALALSQWPSHATHWTEELRKASGLIGPAFAAFMTANFVWMAWRYKIRDYLCVAAVSLAAGAWTWGNHDAVKELLKELIFVGGVLALMGALRLRSFLAANPLEDHGE